MNISIKSALISVYDKTGLDSIVESLHQLGVVIYSTGGTLDYIKGLNIPVESVESLTSYPSILGGRVKTLHPKVFGGILAMRNQDHLEQLAAYDIPTIDLVIVDLYPFEDTVAHSSDHDEIIEKIDIGGISLIRAAAKNYKDVVVVASKAEYSTLLDLLKIEQGFTTLAQRKAFAQHSFKVSSSYDNAIHSYFDTDTKPIVASISLDKKQVLRYGENPHQSATYHYNDDNLIYEQLAGKELSFNNLVDIHAAISLMKEFRDDKVTFAILKHTNACGVAQRPTVVESWRAALSSDPISAFGGILICNDEIDEEVALLINELFYEVLIAPSFSDKAFHILTAKSKRVLLKLNNYDLPITEYKSLLNGVIIQDADNSNIDNENFEVRTALSPSESEVKDLRFALKCAKHLKSNTIVLVKDAHMVSMGCGQTSRLDACKQAIEKAKSFDLSILGAVMASDAFFPFPDCVELVYNEGVRAVVQPGGSIKDQLSIDYCNAHGMSMVFTGIRHFKH